MSSRGLDRSLFMAVPDPGATMKYVMRAHLFEENSANKTARPLTLFKSLLKQYLWGNQQRA